MHVIREDFVIDSSLYSLDFGVKRSLGCHLMQVVDYMDIHDYLEGQSLEDEATRQARFFLGYMWEHTMARDAVAMELAHGAANLRRIGQIMWCCQCERVIHGRVQAEGHCARLGHIGIFATPDAVLVYDWILKEWKFTTKSLRSCGGDEWIPLGETEPRPEHPKYEHISVGMPRWIAQVKGYCYLLGTLSAVLEAAFVVGDYGITTRDSRTCRYRITFEQEELETFWENLVFHAIDGELLKVVA